MHLHHSWPADLSDEDSLTSLVALNKARSAEEAKGVVRWLRPDFHASSAVAPQVNATLDLGEVSAPAHTNVIPWPKTFAEQFSAVAAILAAAPAAQLPGYILPAPSAASTPQAWPRYWMR